MTVDWGNLTGGQVCVAANNACGQGNQTCWDVDVLTPPTAVLSGGGAVCEGSGDAVLTFITLTGDDPWVVTYALNGQPQAPLNIDTSPYTVPLTQPGTCVLLSVTDDFGCSGTVSGQATLDEIPLPVASLSGGGNICENSGDQVLLEISLSGDPIWTVGWQANGIDQAPLNIGTSPFSLPITENLAGNISLTNVVDGNGCVGSVNGDAQVGITTAPTVNNVETTCNATNTEFTVSFNINGGDAATYSITPMDGILLGNVFTSDPIPVGNGYNFTVSDVNDCNPVQVMANIVLCNCTSESGNLQEPLLQFCGEIDFSATYDPSGEVFDGDDALCFVLHEGNVNQPLATNSTPDFSFLQGVMAFNQDYFICPVVGNADGSGCVDLNDPCLDIGDCTTVRFRDLPTATLGADASICMGDNASITVDLTGTGPWQIAYEDAAGNIENLTATSSPFVFQTNPTSDDTYTLIGVEDAFCTGDVFGETNVTVHTAPEAINVSYTCDLANQFYTVSFEITGGDLASYAITPNIGVLLGNAFTSAPIPSGDLFSFEVDDANDCGPAIVAGNHTCLCSTEAGDMTLTTLSFCENETVLVGDAIGSVLDLDDILIYVLHTASGNALGNIIAQNSVPQFVFDPATMMAGTTYYISAVTGNADGMGGVDFTDACTDVSVGTPIVFNALPNASLSDGGLLCSGDSLDVEFTVGGTGPFTVFYEMNNVPAPPLDIPVAGSFPLTISPTSNLDISLISITDNGTGCQNNLTDNISIIVSQPVEAGMALDDYEACEGETDVVDLFQLIGGNDPGGVWTDSNGSAIPNGQLSTSTLVPGMFVFTYSLTASTPCPDDEVSVNVNIHPNPVADAGPDQTLDCINTSAIIGGSNTTIGMEYIWDGPVPITNDLQQTVVAPGTYLLQVISPFGCSNMDEVVISQSNDQPVPYVTVSDVSCFGLGDGYILIDSIVGGQPPYTCSFNGMPFNDEKQFSNLSAGDYSITILDASGCTSTIEAEIVEPTEVTVSIVDPFQGGQQIVELGEPLTLRLITTPPFSELDTVIWTSTTEDVPCEKCEENTFYLNAPTDFSVMISEGSCTDEDFLSVLINKNRDVFFPNAFSPNDDGLNDVFTAFAGSNVAQVKSLLVFDRWGDIVFEYYQFPPNDFTWGWDGKHRGQALGPGVFTWFSEIEFLDGETMLFKGDVVLVK